MDGTVSLQSFMHQHEIEKKRKQKVSLHHTCCFWNNQHLKQSTFLIVTLPKKVIETVVAFITILQ